jgi:phosphoserine phosphatase
LDNHYLLIADFDHALSLPDARRTLGEVLGIAGIDEKIAGLARLNLVQRGAELVYLLRHDPELRHLRRDDLIEVGRQVQLKRNTALLAALLEREIAGYRFDLHVVSAAPQEIVEAALEGIVPPERIVATQLDYDPLTGEVGSILPVSVGQGKVVMVDALQRQHDVPGSRIVYAGDGSLDVQVMLHVDRAGGFTIAVSESPDLVHVAHRTVVSDDAFGLLVPVLEAIVGLDTAGIRALFTQHGLMTHEWEKLRTDMLLLRPRSVPPRGTLLLAEGAD